MPSRHDPHKHLDSLRAYHEAEADIGFKCLCGVRRTAATRDALKAYPEYTDPNQIARKMRCRSCKQKTVTAYPIVPSHRLRDRELFKAHWGFGQGWKD
ncbi:hypothetical protein [Ferrovibrio terrae]|uniref:hypothetical protein n=1 Tax=Ferrovibrio terrae TaxID=2594003 RepID=UPI003137C675